MGGLFVVEYVFTAIIVGMSGAMETLATHANGAGLPKLAGQYLNGTRRINFMIMLALTALIFLIKPVLKGLDKSVEI